MDPANEATDLEPGQLDPWLREHLGRRVVVAGFSMSLLEQTPEGAAALAGAAPEPLVADLSAYGEIWVVWAAAGTPCDDALGRAAAHDADALLIWLPEASDLPPATPDAAPAPIAGTLRAIVAAADALGLRDRALLALVGPGATRTFARRLGFEDGFGASVSPAHVATALARAAVARAEFARHGRSPPCYL
jgi:hypothetical protein